MSGASLRGLRPAGQPSSTTRRAGTRGYGAHWEARECEAAGPQPPAEPLPPCVPPPVVVLQAGPSVLKEV